MMAHSLARKSYGALLVMRTFVRLESSVASLVDVKMNESHGTTYFLERLVTLLYKLTSDTRICCSSYAKAPSQFSEPGDDTEFISGTS